MAVLKSIRKSGILSPWRNPFEPSDQRFRRAVSGSSAGPIIVGWLGQSEIEHLKNSNEYYSQFAAPDVTGVNMIVVAQNGDLVAPTEYAVTNENVAAGLISNSMAVVGCWLRDIAPGRQFVVGDLAVPGTSRAMLADDTTDETVGADGARRYWSDFTSVIDRIESKYGHVQHFIECWYNSDAAVAAYLRDAYWPFYFGAYSDGSEFTLGTSHTFGSLTYQVDHCIYDAMAAPSEKGRGVFARVNTQWHVLTPMPFCDAPEGAEAEALQFTQGVRNEEPLRANIHALESDALAQSVNLIVGPSAHITDFGGGIHPLTDDPDGVVLFAQPFAIAMLRGAGISLGEPTISAVGGATDGTYADIYVDLPNGGNLTTLRQLRGAEMPASPSPHQHEVVGVELFRTSQGSRRPVFKTTETSYPQAFRGTVAIVDSGSGSPRRGIVRITPDTPFAFGDSFSYLRGQASALLHEDRDVPNKLVLDMLIEHIPQYAGSSIYPFYGVPVRPQQSDIQSAVEAPAFVARSARFNGEAAMVATSDIAMTNQGMMILFYRPKDPAMPQLDMLIQAGTGTVRFELSSSSGGRLNLKIHNGSSLVSTPFYSAAGNTPFAVNEGYWIAAEWADDSVLGAGNGRLLIKVDDEVVATKSMATIWAGALTQFGFGADRIARTGPSYGYGVDAEFGHGWLSFSQRLDLSVAENAQKFGAAGSPVDVGSNGQVPTGTAPEIYLDGDGSSWNNLGTAGPLSVTGSITAGADAPGYGV